MTTNPFINEESFYQRNIDPINHYIEQNAIYLSKMSGKPYDDCYNWLSTKLKTRSFPNTRDPQVRHYQRDDVGDKHQEATSLSTYIRNTVKDNRILAPTFTTYLHPSTTVSLLSDFTMRNKAKRSIAKKQAQKARVDKDTNLFIMKNNEQNNMKGYNNSLSGAFATKGSPLHNPTAHNTLTSITRSVTSLGNASNERLIMGNRNYFSPDIVTYAILATCSLIDRKDIAATMYEYNLRYPSVDDVMQVINYSTSQYWIDPIRTDRIRELVSALSDIERAGFVYCGDLYHLRVFNDGFMRDFISELSVKATIPVDDPVKAVKSVDPDIMNYAHQICFEDARGYGKKYDVMPNAGIVVATGIRVVETLDKYRPFIKTFFLSKLMPESHAHLPNIIRRSVVLSDTDSTCFSVDDWLVWYYRGEFIFNETSDAIAGAVALMTTQSIVHLLAMFSANVNVSRDKLHSLAMKNEFLWHVHMPTNVAKHYAALTVMKEGDVFSAAEMEIKGVHLKNSASPVYIIKDAHAMMQEILETVKRNEKIKLRKYLEHVRDIELEIIESLKRGESKYLKQSKIKEPEAYTKDIDESPYQYYVQWEDAWSVAYGKIDPPPFSVVKVPTTLGTKTDLKNWLAGMENRELAGKLGEWLVKHKKDALNTIYLSLPYVQSYGVPKEVLDVVNYRKVVLDLTIVYRIVVEALGFFVKSDWLVSDLEF